MKEKIIEIANKMSVYQEAVKQFREKYNLTDLHPEFRTSKFMPKEYIWIYTDPETGHQMVIWNPPDRE